MRHAHPPTVDRARMSPTPRRTESRSRSTPEAEWTLRRGNSLPASERNRRATGMRRSRGAATEREHDTGRRGGEKTGPHGSNTNTALPPRPSRIPQTLPLN